MKGVVMKKKLVAVISIAAMLVAMIPSMIFAVGNVAYIGETGYPSVAAAVAAVPKDNTPKTIELAKDYTGSGVKVEAGQNIVFDLNGFKWDITDTVGSTGTETNGLQLLKGSTVTIKNGTLTSSTAQLLIQKYCDLTLEDVKVDGTNLKGVKYVLSNNHGETTIGSGTEIVAANGGVAFDVFYWAPAYSDGVTVTIEDGAVIKGKIEYAKLNGSTNDEARQKAKLIITGGIIEGEILDTVKDETGKGNIQISGGEFDSNVSEYLAANALLVAYPDGEGGYIYSAVKPEGNQSPGDAAIENEAIYKGADGVYYISLPKNMDSEMIAYRVNFIPVNPETGVMDREIEVEPSQSYVTPVPARNESVAIKDMLIDGKLPTAKYDGYKLVGWFEAEYDGKVVKYGKEIDPNQAIEGELEYFAKWEKIETPAKPEKSPNTGDNNMAPFAVAGLVLAAMAAVAATRRRAN